MTVTPLNSDYFNADSLSAAVTWALIYAEPMMQLQLSLSTVECERAGSHFQQPSIDFVTVTKKADELPSATEAHVRISWSTVGALVLLWAPPPRWEALLINLQL